MMTYKSSKLRQTDLVFGLQSEFISRSVHADHASVHTAFILGDTLVNTQTHRQTDFDQLYY